MVEDKTMDDFERIMLARGVPDVPVGLAERIIAQAEAMPVSVPRARRAYKSGGGFQRWLDGVLESLSVPQPVYAMALVLAVGVMLGTYTDFSSYASQQTSLDDLIYIGDSAGYGEWL